MWKTKGEGRVEEGRRSGGVLSRPDGVASRAWGRVWRNSRGFMLGVDGREYIKVENLGQIRVIGSSNGLMMDLSEEIARSSSEDEENDEYSYDSYGDNPSSDQSDDDISIDVPTRTEWTCLGPCGRSFPIVGSTRTRLRRTGALICASWYVSVIYRYIYCPYYFIYFVLWFVYA